MNEIPVLIADFIRVANSLHPLTPGEKRRLLERTFLITIENRHFSGRPTSDGCLEAVVDLTVMLSSMSQASMEEISAALLHTAAMLRGMLTDADSRMIECDELSPNVEGLSRRSMLPT